MVLIYLHGFLSAPESKKAVAVGGWLRRHRPDINYICPHLSSYPTDAIATLNDLMSCYRAHTPVLMGSSLGGYWATWLAEKDNLPAVVINPAVKPSILLPQYLGVELKNFYTDETCILEKSDIQALLSVDVEEIRRQSNYWLLVQTDDESLDYSLATRKYDGCRQLVEEGGDHSFIDFERWIPSAVEFLECRREEIRRLDR